MNKIKRIKKLQSEIIQIEKNISAEEKHLKNLDKPEYIAKLVRNTKRETKAFINVLKRKLNELKKEIKEVVWIKK